MPGARTGAFPSGFHLSPVAPAGWKRGDGKQLIKEQGTLPYRERPFCFGLSSGAPDGGPQAFPYGGWDVSGGVSSVDRYIGERIEARGLREGRIRGASAVGHGGRMPHGVEESRGQSLRSFVETLPRGKRARGGPLRAGVSGPFSPPPVAARGTDSAAGRDTSFPLRALWFRPRRPGFRTRRAGPADHASCLRADRPCGRDVPDIAPDPSPVPRAPAAGRRPGACPGAAAGRDGR